MGKLLFLDIIIDLCWLGWDLCEDLLVFIFWWGIVCFDDLVLGMVFLGCVLNVVDFGVFVDIGLSDSGFVYISKFLDRFIFDLYDVVLVGDLIYVWVLDVDFVRCWVLLIVIDLRCEVYIREDWVM